MGDILVKLVKEITDWGPVGVRTTERPKNRWRDEVINKLKVLKLTNWS
jgi:glycyl-tRNA synthetase (class II)